MFWLFFRTEVSENSGMSFRKILYLEVLLQFVDTYQFLLESRAKIKDILYDDLVHLCSKV